MLQKTVQNMEFPTYQYSLDSRLATGNRQVRNMETFNNDNDNRRTIITVSSNSRRRILNEQDTRPIDVNTIANMKHSGKKMCQRLAVPIVLSCILFMVTLWSRQASLVFLKDTLLMLFILGTIFIIMSGVAFWLAQERELDSINQDCDHLNQPPEAGNRISDYLPEHGRLDTTTDVERCPKCYMISIIESEPPEYYAALENSIPIKIMYDNHQIDSSDTKSITSRETLPPNYDDLNCIEMNVIHN